MYCTPSFLFLTRLMWCKMWECKSILIRALKMHISYYCYYIKCTSFNHWLYLDRVNQISLNTLFPGQGNTDNEQYFWLTLRVKSLLCNRTHCAPWLIFFPVVLVAVGIVEPCHHLHRVLMHWQTAAALQDPGSDTWGNIVNEWLMPVAVAVCRGWPFQMYIFIRSGSDFFFFAITYFTLLWVVLTWHYGCVSIAS